MLKSLMKNFTKKKKSLYMHAFKTFKNIIALQDIQIIYLSRPFLFPPFFSHLNLDSIKIAKFAVMIFILSSKNVKKKKKKKLN